jgi:hypothetical protein
MMIKFPKSDIDELYLKCIVGNLELCKQIDDQYQKQTPEYKREQGKKWRKKNKAKPTLNGHTLQT